MQGFYITFLICGAIMLAMAGQTLVSLAEQRTRQLELMRGIDSD